MSTIQGSIPKTDSDAILDLGTKDSKVIELATKYLSKDSDPETRFAIQQLIEQRGRAETALSQILRTLAEAARTIINNIRG